MVWTKGEGRDKLAIVIDRKRAEGSVKIASGHSQFGDSLHAVSLPMVGLMPQLYSE